MREVSRGFQKRRGKKKKETLIYDARTVVVAGRLIGLIKEEFFLNLASRL